MLSTDELSLIKTLEERLNYHAAVNQEKYRYYYQKLRVKDLGISTPPHLVGLHCVLGWGAVAVDVIEERILYRGLYSPKDNERLEKLNKLYRQNDVEVIQRGFHKDGFIVGTSYLSIGAGDTSKGEPEVIFRAESPNEMYGDFDYRTRRLNNAIKVVRVGEDFLGTLWLPNVTIQMKRVGKNQNWHELSRDEHNLGRVSIVEWFHEQDSMHPRGRSAITPSVRSHTDSGMRVLLGTEVAREFFAQPLRSVTNAPDGLFENEDGESSGAWQIITSKVVTLPAGEDGQPGPRIEQLPASNPENIMNLLPKYAVLVAREIGVSPSYLGFETANPTSSDAMSFADAKLLHKVYKQQPEIGRAWKQANEIAQLIMDGEVMDEWEDVEATFMRPEAPSPAAAADRMSKLVAAQVFERELPDFIYRELGFREVEILQLKQWMQNNAGQDLVKKLIEQSVATTAPLAPAAPAIEKAKEEEATETDTEE